jgi:tetratricopeptide (TPR) repeat protein
MVFGWFSKDKGADAKLGKAQKLQGQGRWAEALTYYDEVLDGDPGSADARAGARRCREQLVAWNLEEARSLASSEPEKARDHARLALELAAGEEALRTSAWDVLEGLRSRSGPVQENRAAEPREPLFAGSCSCASPCATALPEGEELEHASIEDLFGFYLEAMRPAERAPFEAEGASFREGFVLLQQGNCREARPALEGCCRGRNDSPVAPYALGLLADFEGRPADAEKDYRAALAVDPTFGPAARHLAHLFREASRPSEALEVLQGHLAAAPDDAEAHSLAATCHLDLGEFESAVREAAAARGLAASEEVGPALLLAQAHRRSGEREQALRVLQEVLARKPDLVPALAAAGDILLEEGEGRAERAAELFKRCYRNDPENGWMYLLKVAEAYATLGRKAEAAEVLARAEEELPDTSEARRAWEAVRTLGTEV